MLLIYLLEIYIFITFITKDCFLPGVTKSPPGIGIPRLPFCLSCAHYYFYIIFLCILFFVDPFLFDICSIWIKIIIIFSKLNSFNAKKYDFSFWGLRHLLAIMSLLFLNCPHTDHNVLFKARAGAMADGRLDRLPWSMSGERRLDVATWNSFPLSHSLSDVVKNLLNWNTGLFSSFHL
jgi:hypothetical protein